MKLSLALATVVFSFSTIAFGDVQSANIGKCIDLNNDLAHKVNCKVRAPDGVTTITSTNSKGVTILDIQDLRNKRTLQVSGNALSCNGTKMKEDRWVLVMKEATSCIDYARTAHAEILSSDVKIRALHEEAVAACANVGIKYESYLSDSKCDDGSKGCNLGKTLGVPEVKNQRKGGG